MSSLVHYMANSAIWGGGGGGGGLNDLIDTAERQWLELAETMEILRVKDSC